MNYEKIYKDALERMKSWARGEHPECFSEAQKAAEFVFPELAESKDKMMIKSITRLVNAYYDVNFPTPEGFERKDILAWLEKQGEQILANSAKTCKDDKPEPKFHEGDWIVFNGLILHIDEVVSGYYRTTSIGYGIHNSYDWDIDNVVRLWTIQDAKDGDVLVVDSKPFIYNGSKNEVTVGAYCGFNSEHKFSFAYNYVINQNITPATKEQRDFLFQKMKEAGYEWDAEKKKLKKVSQRMISAEAKEALYGKPAWSEDDEEILQGIWDEILANKHEAKEYEWKTYDKFLNWLKSLKDRVQPKQEWQPKVGDTFKKKGTEKPLFHLCCKNEDCSFSFVQEMEDGIAGGAISLYSLQKDYEPVNT